MSKVTVFNHLPNAIRTRSGMLRSKDSLEVEIDEAEKLFRLYKHSIAKLEGKIVALDAADDVEDAAKPSKKSKKDKVENIAE